MKLQSFLQMLKPLDDKINQINDVLIKQSANNQDNKKEENQKKDKNWEEETAIET